MTRDTPTDPTLLALSTAIEVADERGLDTAGAELLRAASSTMVLLPRADAVARVEPPESVQIARRQVCAAAFLQDRGVPALRLLGPEPQPHLRPGGAVTLWRRLEILPRTPTPEELGHVARDLHAATRDDLPADMPWLDPFSMLRDQLARPAARALVELAEGFEAQIDALEERWQALVLNDPRGSAFVHGDYHIDNLVITPEGPVLLDLELSGRGPVSWDLAAQWVAVSRYGAPIEGYERFCDAYGWDLRTWSGSEALCQIYALLMVSWALSLRDTSPRMDAEAAIRLGGFLGLDDRPWTLL